MIGLLYLILCIIIGWGICTYAFPGLAQITERDYEGRTISLSPYLLLYPAWFVTGTLILTWATYLCAYVFGSMKEPLLYANAIVMPIAIVISAIIVYRKIKDKQKIELSMLSSNTQAVRLELILIAAILVLGSVLMWTTFFIRGNQLYVGVSVFSDFSPHIGMIRSFSYGNNFPTTYSHYAGEDIRYHFMFQFLVGNLEYLGMRLDYAFNIPSILSFVSAFSLLYILAVKITGKLSAGVLSCLFFAFRSAKTLYTYLSKLPEGTNIRKALAQNNNFISDTPHEDWGLWNLNVYCNQRHLAFGLTVMFLVLILFLPRLYELFHQLRKCLDRELESNQNKNVIKTGDKISLFIKTIFLNKEAWVVQDYKKTIILGILLGGLAFFHGAAAIACLIMLFFMAIFSTRRLEYLITAGIALALFILQTKFFIHGSAVEAKYYFGFIAENKTIFGVASYLERLLGILPFVLLAAFCLEKGVGRYLIFVFSTPLIFALTVSLTVDVTVNHKYIMMSCILLGIFAASLISKMFERREFTVSVIGVLLVISLTATGVYDFITVLNKNTPASAVTLKLNDPLTKWIDQNSDSKDIFLTSNYALNQVVLGGAMLYEGWPYFPWSAGYNTDYRTAQVKKMYEAASPKELIRLVKQEKIRFIIVDQDNRESTDYKVNVPNIEQTYQCVYTQGEGENKLSIYDTKKPLIKG